MHRAEAATVPAGCRSESHRPSIQTHVTHLCARVRDSRRARLVCCEQLIFTGATSFYILFTGATSSISVVMSPPQKMLPICMLGSIKNKWVITEQRNNKTRDFFFFGWGELNFRKNSQHYRAYGSRSSEIPFKGCFFQILFQLQTLPCLDLCHSCRIPACIQNLPFGFAGYRREFGGNQSSPLQPGVSAFT